MESEQNELFSDSDVEQEPSRERDARPEYRQRRTRQSAQESSSDSRRGSSASTASASTSSIADNRMLLDQEKSTGAIFGGSYLHSTSLNGSLSSLSAVSLASDVANLMPIRPSGLVYDVRMLAHDTLSKEDKDHPECPDRLRFIYEAFRDAGLLFQFKRVKARTATKEEILLFHSGTHFSVMQKSENMETQQLMDLAQDYNSVYLNANSAFCALIACGGLLELVDAIWNGHVRNGFALIRPPGHHAEAAEPMGFCIYNNVAVASRQLQKVFSVKRILIVDWDVHHGNGTQQAFYDDPSVLFVSIHRYDNGRFYPGTTDANYTEIGKGDGLGRNINVPWPSAGFEDVDYLYTFNNLIMPIAHEFNPDFVIVSAGFDAALHDPIGGCRLTPAGYSQMTYMLAGLAGGKIALALEGGYSLKAISASATACAKVLLGHPPTPIKTSVPSAECVEVIQNCKEVLSPYWNCLQPLHVEDKPVSDSYSHISLNKMIRVYRQHIITENYDSTKLEKENVPGDLTLRIGSKNAVLFVHDGPFVRFSSDAFENLLVPDSSHLHDASLSYIEYFYKKGWTFVDVMLPYFETRQSTERYPRVRDRPLHEDNKMRTAIDDLLLQMFDDLKESNKLSRVVLLVAGFACDSIEELLLSRNVESFVQSVILICSPKRAPPLLRGPKATASKFEWLKRNSIVYVPEDPIGPVPHGRFANCLNTGYNTTPMTVLETHKDEILQYITSHLS